MSYTSMEYTNIFGLNIEMMTKRRHPRQRGYHNWFREKKTLEQKPC